MFSGGYDRRRMLQAGSYASGEYLTDCTTTAGWDSSSDDDDQTAWIVVRSDDTGTAAEWDPWADDGLAAIDAAEAAAELAAILAELQFLESKATPSQTGADVATCGGDKPATQHTTVGIVRNRGPPGGPRWTTAGSGSTGMRAAAGISRTTATDGKHGHGEKASDAED